MPRFIKNRLMGSGKHIAAKIISDGKNAIKNAAKRAALLLSVKRCVTLYVSRILKTEKTKRNIRVAVSFEPNIIIERDVKPMKAILKGKTG